MRVIFLSALCASLLLCAAPPSDARPEKAGISAADRFAAMDADKDGSVSRDEFFKAQPNMKEAAFGAIDKNGDGQISAEEWTSFTAGHGKEEASMPPSHPPLDQNDKGRQKAAPELLMPPDGK